MLDFTLPADKLAELRAAHRRTHDKREADRLKAIILLAETFALRRFSRTRPDRGRRQTG